MRHQTQLQAGWQDARPMAGMPMPLDCESRAMLRQFLAPILEQAESWPALAERLHDKGYALAFRQGHLVVLNDLGSALCTGSDLGVPMAAIAERIGRPCVRAHRGGHSGELRDAVA